MVESSVWVQWNKIVVSKIFDTMNGTNDEIPTQVLEIYTKEADTSVQTEIRISTDNPETLKQVDAVTKSGSVNNNV